jgi:hypothetical protein
MRRSQPFRVINAILDNSLLRLAGTAAAVVWANLDAASYGVSGGSARTETKMGALLSVAAAPLALVLARARDRIGAAAS